MRDLSTFSASLTTPVLFMIFSRPETTRQVFEVIRMARPTRLYVAADGPRSHKIGEATKCEEAKSIIDGVDWECEVHTLYRTENLGLGQALSSAITWFFEHEEEGIILEDDCLPSMSFFTFCAQLLEKYRDDTRVMEIGGNNFEGPTQTEYSYRFSNLTYIWGWATWRRAWKLFDFKMNHYPEINIKHYLAGAFGSIYERDYYNYVFKKMHQGDEKISSRTIWSYQWQFACKINSGLIIVPNRNLIKNLGFGEFATNTISPTAVGYDLKMENMEFPLRHPEFVMVDNEKESQVFELVCTSPSSRVKSQIKNILPEKVVDTMVKPFMALFA